MYEFKRYVANLYIANTLVVLDRFPTSKPYILMQFEFILFWFWFLVFVFPENVYHNNKVAVWHSLDSRKLVAV